MTSLGIVDMLDSRGARPAGPGSSPRHATPGAAAFADVIQDAARTPDPDGSRADSTPVETAIDEPPGGVLAPSAPAAPDLRSIAPALTAVDVAPDAGALVAVPAEDSSATATLPPTAAAADAAMATGGIDESTALPAGVVAADLATTTGSNSAHSVAAGTGASATAVGSPPMLPPQGVPRTPANPVASATAVGIVTGSSSPAAEPSALPPASVLGSAGVTEGATTAAAPRISIVGGTGASVTTTRSERIDSTALTADDAPDSTAPIPVPAAATPAPLPATTTTEAPPAAPAVGGTTAAAPASAAAPPAAASAARPVLLPQIAAPIVSLAQAADGDHSLTLTVSPENLGPVTVRAHISGGAIHIELHAPTDLGRDALRALLVDLRRDLAVAAPHASLLLSTADDGPGSASPQNSPSGNGSAQGGASNGTASGSSAGDPGGRDAPGARSTPAAPATEEPSPLPLATPHGGIEVFA